jgi:hypothetical protein
MLFVAIRSPAPASNQLSGSVSNFTLFGRLPRLITMDVVAAASQSPDRSDQSAPDAQPQHVTSCGIPDPFVAGARMDCSARLPHHRQISICRLLHIAAVCAGISSAILISVGGGLGAAWDKFENTFSTQSESGRLSTVISESDLDRRKPQEQAEILLERAITHGERAPSQIEARVDGWRGRLKWDAQLGELTSAALNENDREVQNSAIDVQLAAYGLSKNQASVDALVRQAESPEHARKIWALWSLGLLANRGVDTDHIVRILTVHLKDSAPGLNRNSEEVRRWAVEGLALIGTTSTIMPLLDAMRNDPDASVRECAAGSLARYGMLSHEQRLIAVPQLIGYSADSSLDDQTRGWAFQALADITGQRLPKDSTVWRNWYQNSGAAN